MKLEKFCNTQRFRMYAILFKKNIFSRWRYIMTMNGDKALFNKGDAEKVAELISSGEWKKYAAEG